MAAILQNIKRKLARKKNLPEETVEIDTRAHDNEDEIIDLVDSLQVGDRVHFLGRSTDFLQEITSMQIEHESIAEAGKGQEVAVKVERRVRNHDKVFKITEED